MVFADAPRGGVPVYTTGTLGKTVRISPGTWNYVVFEGVRGIVSIAISNLTNPQPLGSVVAGSYICKVYSRSVYKQPNPNPPNFETDNTDVILTWKDVFGIFTPTLRVPDGTAQVFVAVKNTTTSDTLILTVSVEV